MPPNFLLYVDEADNPHCVIRTLEVNQPKPVPLNRTLSVESPLVHICTNNGAVIIAGVCNKSHRHNFISAIDYMSGARVWEIRGMCRMEVYGSLGGSLFCTGIKFDSQIFSSAPQDFRTDSIELKSCGSNLFSVKKVSLQGFL